MPPIQKIFAGKLNLDDSPYRVPPQDHIDALNITRDSQGTGQDVVVANINGNRIVTYTLPAGTNKCIGQFADKVRNRIYYYVWNSNGNHLWLYYDRTTDTIVKLIEDLTDTDDVAVLDFNPSKKINHIDIIYRDDEGDLVSWTDGNTSPKEANVQTIIDGTYGTIQVNFIEAAKRPPLSPPTGVYGSDTTRIGNALRKKLFQFCHAFKYDTFAISTPSTFSKIPLPIGFYGSDNDIDSSNNNFITLTVETGDKNVTDIEIYMRNNIGDAWSDFVTIVVLNKEQLGIPDNSTYDYLFYNDNIYPTPTENFQYVDGVQVVPLFDWIPQLADTQCQPNGNVKSYGAITENYDNISVNDLDVTITAENKTNIPPDTDPPSMTYVQVAQTYTFTIAGSIPEGTLFKVVARVNVPPLTYMTIAEYTSVAGDGIPDVAQGMYNYVLANHSSYAEGYNSSSFWINIPSGSSIIQTIVNEGSGGGGGDTIESEKTWLWGCPYAFGIVYVDEQNRDMPGVTTFANPTDSDNDFIVNTPAFSEDAGNAQTPVISASINHLPPAGAVKYYWVRRRLAFGSFLFYETCDFQEDDDYYYFCLANIEKYKTDNSQFIYGTAPITNESRIKVVDSISSSLYDGRGWTQDYEILGTVTKTLSGGSSPDNDVPFIKVAKPSVAPSPAYPVKMLVMIYTPMANPTNEDSVYYEWGEAYDIYELDGVRYHRGQDQDQTASQPATFTWIEGDVYFHRRKMYNNIVFDPPLSDTVSIMDANFSDFFDSAVNDNGRAQAIEVNARRQFNPVLQRFSLAYQSGTNINGLNRFYAENFDEYDRSWGKIVKEFIDRRYMYVFQEFNTGVVPVLQQIVTDTAGNPLQANSDILLNKIQYPYDKQYGMGNVPESFAYGKGAMYGVDNNKGIVWRLSQDGMTALSILYKTNAFFVDKLAAYNSNLNNGNAASGQPYTGNPTVYGVYDQYTNKYIVALEEINRYNDSHVLTFHQDAYTLSFNETRDTTEGFDSPLSYHPEMMSSLNNLLVTFKNGALWKHDNLVYCNFYGVQYDAYIKVVFNDNELIRKVFRTISQQSNVAWECPEMQTNIMSYGTTPQQSNLIESDFELTEGNYKAAILNDTNSIGGIADGDVMRGNYLIVKFQVTNASDFVFLNMVSVGYIVSKPLPQ